MPPKKRAAADKEGTPPPTADDEEKKKPEKKPKREKVVIPDHIPQTPAPRQHQPPAASATSRPTFKAVAWNVAGIRSLLEKSPTMLQKIAREEAPDVICVQEHKLQESHVDDVVTKLRELLPEYPTMHFAVSTAKKGYSGVAVFARATLASAPAGAAGGGEDDDKKKAKKGKQQGTLLGGVAHSLTVLTVCSLSLEA